MPRQALVVEGAQLATLLRAVGWEVALVTADEARAQAGPFDLIVCSLRVSTGCGARLLKQLRRQHPRARGLLAAERLLAEDSKILAREAMDVSIIRVPTTPALLALGISAS